jgi:hypothetical protein
MKSSKIKGESISSFIVKITLMVEKMVSEVKNLRKK